MNPSLLTTRERTVGDQFDFGWFILVEFAAEDKDIFYCFFSQTQKTVFLFLINSLHYSIIFGVVLVGLVVSDVKYTGGG